MHPLGQPWIFEARFRYYTQNNADFYSDIFPRAEPANFLARDKELSTFNSQTLASARPTNSCATGWRFVKKGTLNLVYDHMSSTTTTSATRASRCCRPTIRTSGRPAAEPLYTFGANVFQVFVSIWF